MLRKPASLWVAGALGAAVLVAGLLGLVVDPTTRSAAADESDAAVAATLLASGRSALSKRKYDEAIAHFDRAIEEDAEAIEALYWKGQALEKMGRPSAALAAYREFLALFEIKDVEETASKKEISLAGKAKQRDDKLGQGERDLGRLNEAFASRLAAFAKKYADDDPAAARKALEHALRADPTNATAQKLFAQFGGEMSQAADDAPVAAGPFARIVNEGEWHDLLTRKSLGTELADYAGGRMSINVTGGKILTPVERIQLADGYVYEADFRVLLEHERAWLAGIVVGWSGGEFYTTFLQTGQVILNRAHARKGPQEDVDVHPLPPFKPSDWHRLGVRVNGSKLQVWLDGKLILKHDVGDAAKLQGDVGVFQQGCKAEYRLLRAGKTE